MLIVDTAFRTPTQEEQQLVRAFREMKSKGRFPHRVLCFRVLMASRSLPAGCREERAGSMSEPSFLSVAQETVRQN